MFQFILFWDDGQMIDTVFWSNEMLTFIDVPTCIHVKLSLCFHKLNYSTLLPERRNSLFNLRKVFVYKMGAYVKIKCLCNLNEQVKHNWVQFRNSFVN